MARREVAPEKEACGEVEFWYCDTCGVSKVVTTGRPAEWDFKTHEMLHRVKAQRFPSPFGPRLVWDRDRVEG